MITRIAHICITAESLEKTGHFYCDGLGMKRHFDFLRDGNLFGFYLDAGGDSFIEVFRRDGGAPPPEGAIRHVCLETDDIDAAIAQVREAGYEASDKKMGSDQSWQCWLTDPDGVRIELHQYTPESSQRMGTDCHVNW